MGERSVAAEERGVVFAIGAGGGEGGDVSIVIVGVGGIGVADEDRVADRCEAGIEGTTSSFVVGERAVGKAELIAVDDGGGNDD